MMVETILECSQEFGMSSGAVPQWKRELLQRRAARPRPPPPAPPPPPPPAPSLDDDEELRYGPGIVKRLQSRYLSLALRDQSRRRAAVLRRAASLEHLLDEPPRPARPPRPASLALSHPAARRDSIKRARSVDALSRLDRRPPSPAIACTTFNGTADSNPSSNIDTACSETVADPAPVAPPPPTAPPLPRSARPPRRPQPLLRDTEKPPPDLVRSALRKFEPTCPKRGAPAARVAAVLRGLEPARGTQPRTSTPEPRGREPSPAGDLSAIDEPECASPAAAVTRPVSRAALDGIAKAGSTMKFSFPVARAGTHLPPLAATNTVLVARRVGVIRPLPPATPPPPPPKPDDLMEKISLSPRLAPAPPPPPPPPTSPPPVEVRLDKREPPAALVEPMLRSPLQEIQTNAQFWERRVTETPERAPREIKSTPPVSPPLEPAKPEPLTNGHKGPSPPPCEEKPAPEHRVNGKLSKISAAKIERAWNSPSERKDVRVREKSAEVNGVSVSTWARGSPAAGRKRGAPPPAAAASVSVVFNFSGRKEVPDYIENDGVILRASKRDKIKAGDPGVVVLDPALALGDSDSDSDSERQLALSRPPSPCAVRFVNDNVLINGKSSLLVRDNHARLNKLKLQFDDSLTRTFEYPSETSLCEDDSPHPAAPHPAHLAANTHIASAALSGYTPSKTRAEEFRLGVTRHESAPAPAPTSAPPNKHDTESSGGCEEPAMAGDVRACGGGAARSWSEARTHRTDLLF